jgi:hypothetical protein
MQFAKRLFLGLGAIALMALLLTLAAPKTVHGLVATLVQVANTTGNPVPNRDVDDPGHATLVVLSCASITHPNDNFFACFPQNASQCCSGPTYVVPAGYRLAIQEVDGICSTPNNQSINYLGLVVSTNGYSTPHWLPLVNQGAGEPTTVPQTILENELAVHFYADPGSSLVFGGYQSDSTNNTTCTFTVSGYLVSYP